MDINVKLDLSVINDNGNPTVIVIINNRALFEGTMSQPTSISASIKLTELLDISISMQDKQYSANCETAVLINSLSVDGIELAHKYSHVAVYENDHQNNNPTAYLGFNGTWKFQLDQPFYRWLHQVTGQGWLIDPV